MSKLVCQDWSVLGDIGCEKGKKRVQNTTSLSKINERKSGPAQATKNKMTCQ